MNKNLCRAELHLHTKCSDTVSVISPGEAMQFAIENSIKTVGFTNRDNVQDFHEIAKEHQKYKDSGLKVIYGAEVLHADEDGSAANGVTVLVKNQAGLKGLYKIISSIEFDGACDLASLDVLKQNRKNLLFGSCGNYGLLYGAMCYNYTNEQIERIAAFYDYFEIFPTDDPEEREIYKRIYELGEKLGVPVVAAGNCHYVSEKDELCRRVVRAMYGHENDNKNLYFRTTEQMLEEFSYLGEDAALKVVIENPNLIAGLIEEVSPIKEGFYPPKIENAYEQISEIAVSKAKEIYGKNLPAPIAERLNTELCYIKNNDFATYYFIAYRLVKRIKDLGYYVGTRGAVGSSLVAFFLEISDVNPLKAHYYCPRCHYNSFETDVADGFDLAHKNCPVCKAKLKADGHNIPYETFTGCDGDKIPDIDLNFPCSVQYLATEYVKEMFGEAQTAYAGTVSRLLERMAELYIDAYQEKTATQFTKEQREHIRKKLVDVKRQSGQHPGGVFVLPQGMEFEDFTPILKNDGTTAIQYTTHLDFHFLHNNIIKLDILGHIVPDFLKLLEEYTGVSIQDVACSDSEIYGMFECADTLAIPEFSSDFMRNMLRETSPNGFDDLIKITGISHGTNVWLDNGDILIDEGKALNQLPTVRDDVFLHLTDCGVDRKDAFKIAEIVRRGRLSLENDVNCECIKIMKEAGVEDWYIDSLKKIRYMFPKAHAVSYVMNAVRCAWFKRYYPAEYYAAYLTCFFGNKKEMDEYEQWQYDEILNECRARGIELLLPDKNHSHPEKYIVYQGNILMPHKA